MRARAGQLAAIDDQILLTNRALLKPAFENLAGTGGISSLRRQGCPGGMWRHAVMRHGSPRVILWRRLRIPDIAGITGELPALQCAYHRVAIADLAARGVDEVGTALHLADERVVEHVLGLRVQRRVDRDHVANTHERFNVVV